MGNVLTILFFLLPLSVDTFAIAAAVGANQLTGWSRWRISMIFAVFEGGAPLVSLSLGSSVGGAVGGVAEYLSGGLIILLGGYLWRSDRKDDNDDEETEKARRLIDARGFTLIGLALSVSLDELAIGFSFGIGANSALPTTIIAAIALQALAISQLGLSVGTWISRRMRERIEHTAAPFLILLGLYPFTKVLLRIGLNPSGGAAIAGMLVLILAVVIIYRRFRVVPPQTVIAVPPETQQRPVLSTPTNQRNDSWVRSAAREQPLMIAQPSRPSRRMRFKMSPAFIHTADRSTTSVNLSSIESRGRLGHTIGDRHER